MIPKPNNIKSLARTKHAFMLMFGDSGVGKTSIIGTHEPAEGKTGLIVRPPTEHTDAIKRADGGIEEWIVKGWNDMNEVEEYLRNEGAKYHDLVSLDSISLFQDTGLDEIWADVIAAKPHRAQYGLDKGEYGVNMTRLGRWCRSIVGLDEFHFVVTAHPEEMVVPATGEMKLQPYVQGRNMTTKIQGYMNMVAYLEKKKVGKDDKERIARILRTEDSEDYVAKDQFNAFANGRLLDPTMPEILAAIEASRPKPAVKKRRARGAGSTSSSTTRKTTTGARRSRPRRTA